MSDDTHVIKGTVTGSVTTTKFLLVEAGAKIVANVRAGSAKISGEVRGNVKIAESLELTATAGDMRLRWDVRVNVQAGRPSRVELSNVNAMHPEVRR